jgi:hypothetical protein
MSLKDTEFTHCVESLDGRYAIITLAEPTEFECGEPSCRAVHLANVVLMDRTRSALVPFATVQDAKVHVAGLGATDRWRARGIAGRFDALEAELEQAAEDKAAKS